jgi:hypothetical protein
MQSGGVPYRGNSSLSRARTLCPRICYDRGQRRGTRAAAGNHDIKLFAVHSMHLRFSRGLLRHESHNDKTCLDFIPSVRQP